MYSRAMLEHDYPIELVCKYNENKNNIESNKNIL